ncbi:hypothetical protein [Thermococcus barophilus]|uniref:Uncharacterized protein n=1 Tax=Thermococcus barophilus (strain DSM 11836 / MP) TaxID=391623 RepID=F0LIA3_THEBM|nr:hypothetical protein [Thermococcus barophilus]ADT84433.1 hypothetical protein TERMP_01458 [Thermococcus barophilus MP]
MKSYFAVAIIFVVLALLFGTFSLERSKNAAINESSATHVNFSNSCIHPGYGEFNVHNILFNTSEKLPPETVFRVAMPRNTTIRIKGIIFAKEYAVKEATSPRDVNKTKCYYDGKAKLKAFIGEPNLGDAWSTIQEKLKEPEELEVEIIPSEVDISLEKNATFEVKINTKNAEEGKTYYIYIVAFGERGWKSWAEIEVKIWKITASSTPRG